MNGNFIKNLSRLIGLKNQIFVLYVIGDENLNQPYEIVDETYGNVIAKIIYFKKTDSFINKFQKPFSYFKYYKKGWKLIASEFGRPDIVHVNVLYPIGLFSLYLKKRYRIPYLCTEHWTGYLDRRSIKIGWSKKLLTKLIARNSSILCPVSSDLQKGMVSNGIKGNYQIIPNGIDNELFYPNSKAPKQYDFIHVSNCRDEHKNVRGILSAFDQLANHYPKATLLIICEKNPEILTQLITKHNFKNLNKLSVLVEQDAKDVASLMRSSKAMVMFSNYETFSIVLAEAWSCGLPAIYSKCGGLTEIYNPKIGIQISPNDEYALQNAMEKVLTQENLFEQDEMDRLSKMFSNDRVLEQYCLIYNQIAKL